ncbi:MAG: endolytic transglycosylase MltG [Deltaproteobacteria bacterium]|nr:endolytic transglycosylase MltG [Deltaproteobacteria bacterium]
MRKRTKLLLGSSGLLLGIIAVILWDMHKFVITPANQVFGEEGRYYYLTIESGASFDKVAEDIFNAHGISSVRRFKLLGYWKRRTANIKAGEFEFSTAWSPEQVLDQLVNGRALLHRVTIPEGLPWWAVGKILENQGFVRAEDFAQLVNDAPTMRRYGIPFANAEGFLYPETYMLNKASVPTRAHAQSAMQTMIQTFWLKTAPFWEERANSAGAAFTPTREGVDVTASGRVIASFVPGYARLHPEEVKRIVILASLVEKESAAADERPRVAGVYTNRLNIRMPLQCDPTVIYGLGESFAGVILRSHLLDAGNPYNTYKFYGLPPGPICSPGLGSLRAAFYPERNKYFYFVASGKGDGRHVFSATLAEHNAAVSRYRELVGRAGR